MKDYSIKSRILWIGLILMLSATSLMGQFVIPQGKPNNGEYTFKDALKDYDQWASVPANLDRKGWKAYGRFMEFNHSRLNPDGNPADDIRATEIPQCTSQKYLWYVQEH